VTVSKADASGVAGSFACTGIERADGKAKDDATGTFSAGF
jgi:hypothetical protein